LQDVPNNLWESAAAYEEKLLERAITAHPHNHRTKAAALGLPYNQHRNDLRKHVLFGSISSA
jgi:hypothetical protein